jgi:hypothetical protein
MHPEQLGAMGRAFVEREHGWDTVFDRIFDVYRDVIARSRDAGSGQRPRMRATESRRVLSIPAATVTVTSSNGSDFR